MKQIPLNQGMSVYLDDEDFEHLSQFHWCYRRERHGESGYAIRHVTANGKMRNEYLHRAIMQPPPGLLTIFLNHDTLDCTRVNLLNVTKEEARRHHRVRVDSKTGVRGLRFNPDGQTWSPYLYRRGHAIHLGTFSSESEAIEAYQQAILAEYADLHSVPALIERRLEPPPAECVGVA